MAQVIEINSPLALVILMLGTNDFQCTHDNNAWLSAQGVSKLIDIIRQSPIEPGMQIPKIMVVSPPKIVKPKGVIAGKFLGAEKRCIGFAEALKIISDEKSTHYFDAANVTEASLVDGIHLDKNQHQTLGEAVAKYVLSLSIF